MIVGSCCLHADLVDFLNIPCLLDCFKRPKINDVVLKNKQFSVPLMRKLRKVVPVQTVSDPSDS